LGDELAVRVAEEGADAERLDELAQLLRAELLRLDVDDVRPLRAGDAPPGARGLDVIAVGGLLVTIGRSVGGLMPVVSAISKWLSRGGEPTRKVRIQVGDDALELSSVTAAEQERLIAMFVSRHSGGEGAEWLGGGSP